MFNGSLTFEMKTFYLYCEKGLYQKVGTHKLCQNANFGNVGTTIQISILHVRLNILSISLPSRVQDTSGYFVMQKEKSYHSTL